MSSLYLYFLSLSSAYLFTVLPLSLNSLLCVEKLNNGLVLI
jgi:hypothetical protein